MSLEPGGQFEVATPPLTKLWEVDQVIEESTAAIEAALEGTPWQLVCVGHAPVTPVAEIGMLPRERYRIMDARMPSRGPLTRNMMRGTAGFQLTYDVDDREDAGRKLALLYRLSPILLAISANSRQIEGRDSGWASFRHHVWWETDRDRSGVPEGCLFAETALEGYIEYAKRARVMFLHGENDLVAAPDLPLVELAARGVVTEADVDLHLSGLFPFVRLRNYIEVRCFDSLPWELTRSVMALVSGLIYCRHARAAVWGLSEAFLVEDPAALRALHEDAARRGLEARTPTGRSFASVARDMVEIARGTLGGETCDWAEPEDLDAIAARIDAVGLPA
jgi:glutamate--cysteine ligase